MLIEVTKKALSKYTNINNPVVLAPIKSIKDYFLSQAKTIFPTSKNEKNKTKHLFNVCEVVVADKYSLHSPCIGAPVITFILEPLLQLGVKDIFLFSICGGIRGGLAPNINIGDLIIPTGALCDEGTSPHYGASEEISYAYPRSQQLLENKIQSVLATTPNVAAHRGKIWTTDAIYKETTERVNHYSTKNAVGVDMEMSAVLHLCNLYGARLCSLFVVSDLAGIDFQVGLHQETFHQSMKLAANILAQTLKDSIT